MAQNGYISLNKQCARNILIYAAGNCVELTCCAEKSERKLRAVTAVTQVVRRSSSGRDIAQSVMRESRAYRTCRVLTKVPCAEVAKTCLHTIHTA